MRNAPDGVDVCSTQSLGEDVHPSNDRLSERRALRLVLGKPFSERSSLIFVERFGLR